MCPASPTTGDPPNASATGVIDPDASIHESADVEPGVSIGARTRIWQRAQVRARARIGVDCIVGRDAFVDEGVQIGDRVKIQNQALVYHGVAVEDGVFIGPNAILTNDRHPRAITGDGRLARGSDWTVSPITLRRGCSIGAGAVVVAGVEIGEFATVGAGAVVTHNVRAHVLVVGNPARPVGLVCSCGHVLLRASDGSRANESDTDQTLVCDTCGRRFRYGDNAELCEQVAAGTAAAPR